VFPIASLAVVDRAYSLLNNLDLGSAVAAITGKNNAMQYFVSYATAWSDDLP
jgi:hypothetical protein